MGPVPIAVGWTTDQSAFDAEFVRLGIVEQHPMLNAGAHATSHFLVKPNGRCAIIAIDPQVCSRPKAQAAALIAHEAVHVAQELRTIGREGAVGFEIEAYTVQFITQSILEEIWTCRARVAVAR